MCVRASISTDGEAVCFRRDAGIKHWRHQIGQAVLAMFPRRERAQAVAGRQAQARRRVQVRIRKPCGATDTPRHLSCVLYHISEALTYAGPQPTSPLIHSIAILT